MFLSRPGLVLAGRGIRGDVAGAARVCWFWRRELIRVSVSSTSHGASRSGYPQPLGPRLFEAESFVGRDHGKECPME